MKCNFESRVMYLKFPFYLIKVNILNTTDNKMIDS